VLKELLNELVSIDEVIAGSERELLVVSKLRDYFTELGLEVKLHPINVITWEDIACDVNGYICRCLPPITTSEVRGKLTDNIVESYGKVLLLSTTDFPDNVWVLYNLAVEAGAEAVIFYDSYPGRFRRIVVSGIWSYSFGSGRPPPIPAVHMRFEDGVKMKELIGKYVELRCKTDIRGGVGYNVEVVIGGSREGEVLVSAHHDRWFTGYRDNVVGLYTLLKLAEVVSKSRIKHTLRLVSFTAEEFGNPNLSPWYWSYGSREFVRNTDLSNLEFVVNLDTACMEPIRVNATGPEIGKFFIKYSTLKYSYEGFDHPYSDGISFSSLGIPTVTLHNLRDIDDVYHTDLDTYYNNESLIDRLVVWIVNIVNNYSLESLEFKEYYEYLKNSLPPELDGIVSKVLTVGDLLKLSKVFRLISKELVKPVAIGSYRDLNKDLITVLAPHALVINNLRRGSRVDVIVAGDEEVLCCNPSISDEEVISKYIEHLKQVLNNILSIAT
jgi:Iap family predicted aminopeptidase